MSVDLLQEKIRKLKNPSMVDFSVKQELLPAHLVEEEGSFLRGYLRFCRELLEELKEFVPAVRFPFGVFALMGAEGLDGLSRLLTQAKELGYYVVLDAPDIYAPWGAEAVAQGIFGENRYLCDALIVSPYIGSDAVKPFLPYCKVDKAVFLLARSANKTAVELQDLMTGSRLVHGAAVELSTRHGVGVIGKCGYSNVGALLSAGNADSLRTLRQKHNRTFFLVDGLDYPSGNAKNCSHAFDRFGFGAVVCAGPSVTCAWKDGEGEGKDYLYLAKQAAERMKKNITRYITVL